MVSSYGHVGGIEADDATSAGTQSPLARVTLQDYLDEHKALGAAHWKQVISLQHTATIGDALQVMAENRILSCPVVTEPNNPTRNDFLCFIDVLDILQDFLHEKGLREKLLEAVSAKGTAGMFSIIHALEDVGPIFTSKPLISVGCCNNGHIISTAKNGSAPISWLVSHGFLGARTVPPTKACHRIACFDDTGAFTNIISQFDIVEYLAWHPDLLGDRGGKTLEELGLAQKQVICVPANIPAVQAFAIMHNEGVSGAGVVSDGVLVANISISDMRGLLPEHFGALGLPVLEFLESQRGPHGQEGEGAGGDMEVEATTAPEVIQLRRMALHAQLYAAGSPPEDDSHHPAGTPSERRAWKRKRAGILERPVVDTKRDSTLLECIHILVERHLHRVYVVEGGLPVSVVTLTDVLRAVGGDGL